MKIVSVDPQTVVLGVILMRPADGGTTKHLVVAGIAEILRGVYPESIEGIRMTSRAPLSGWILARCGGEHA